MWGLSVKRNAEPAVSDTAGCDSAFMNRAVLSFSLLIAAITLTVSCGVSRPSVSSGPSLYDSYASRYYYHEGVKKADAGEYDAAMDLMSYSLDTDTSSAAACYNMAQYLLSTGEGEKSEQLLKRAIRLEPDNYWYQRLLAVNYSMRHKSQNAIEQLEKMVVQFPGRSDILLELADLYEETGQFSKELRMLDRYGKMEDVEEQLKGRRFLCYLMMGESDSAYYEADRPEEMIERLLQSASSLAGAEIVLQFCRTVISHDPGKYEPYYYGAIIHNLKNETDKALETLDEGVAKVSDHDGKAQLYSMKGQIHHSLGMMKETFADYDSALVHNPDETGVLNNYAYFLSLEDRELEKALGMSARTLEKEPLNATYLDTYAWILFRMHRYQEALSWLEKALRYLDQDNPEIYEHYGDALYMCGEKDKALENWHRAVQLKSESRTIDRKIREEKYLEE